MLQGPYITTVPTAAHSFGDAQLRAGAQVLISLPLLSMGPEGCKRHVPRKWSPKPMHEVTLTFFSFRAILLNVSLFIMLP